MEVLGTGGDVPAARLAEAASTADGLITLLTDRVTRALLESAPRLRVVGNFAVGYDNVDVPAATELGVQVCNTPNVLTEATADLAFSLLLAAARRIVEADRYVRQGAFRKWDPGRFLGRAVSGTTLGIVGFGRIGKAVARRGLGFGMRILYTGPRRAAPDAERALAAEFVDKETLLRSSDFVSLHAPLTDETRHLIDRAALALVKPGSVLVNTARGALVDETALADALASGPLGAAALDVFEHEPDVVPALRGLDNVVLAPHIGSATLETRIRMADAITADVLGVLMGEPPKSPVNHPQRPRGR